MPESAEVGSAAEPGEAARACPRSCSFFGSGAEAAEKIVVKEISDHAGEVEVTVPPTSLFDGLAEDHSSGERPPEGENRGFEGAEAHTLPGRADLEVCAARAEVRHRL